MPVFFKVLCDVSCGLVWQTLSISSSISCCLPCIYVVPALHSEFVCSRRTHKCAFLYKWMTICLLLELWHVSKQTAGILPTMPAVQDDGHHRRGASTMQLPLVFLLVRLLRYVFMCCVYSPCSCAWIWKSLFCDIVCSINHQDIAIWHVSLALFATAGTCCIYLKINILSLFIHAIPTCV